MYDSRITDLRGEVADLLLSMANILHSRIDKIRYNDQNVISHISKKELCYIKNIVFNGICESIDEIDEIIKAKVL